MVGMIQWAGLETGRRGVQMEERSILHLRFLCAAVRDRGSVGALRRRAVMAAKGFRRAGVTRAVLPEGFPFREQLKKYGVLPVSAQPLRRAMAADWVRRTAEARGLVPGGVRVAVSAGCISGELVRTVTELALRERYVLLDVPRGGEALCRRLRQEYGVTLLLEPERQQLERAEIRVCFDRREDLTGGAAVLPVWDETVPLPPLILPPVLEEQLPGGVCREQLLAVLQEAGAIRPGQITLGAVSEHKIPGKTGEKAALA